MLPVALTGWTLPLTWPCLAFRPKQKEEVNKMYAQTVSHSGRTTSCEAFLHWLPVSLTFLIPFPPTHTRHHAVYFVMLSLLCFALLELSLSWRALLGGSLLSHSLSKSWGTIFSSGLWLESSFRSKTEKNRGWRVCAVFIAVVTGTTTTRSDMY